MLMEKQRDDDVLPDWIANWIDCLERDNFESHTQSKTSPTSGLTHTGTNSYNQFNEAAESTAHFPSLGQRHSPSSVHRAFSAPFQTVDDVFASSTGPIQGVNASLGAFNTVPSVLSNVSRKPSINVDVLSASILSSNGLHSAASNPSLSALSPVHSNAGSSKYADLPFDFGLEPSDSLLSNGASSTNAWSTGRNSISSDNGLGYSCQMSAPTTPTTGLSTGLRATAVTAPTAHPILTADYDGPTPGVVGVPLSASAAPFASSFTPAGPHFTSGSFPSFVPSMRTSPPLSTNVSNGFSSAPATSYLYRHQSPYNLCGNLYAHAAAVKPIRPMPLGTAMHASMPGPSMGIPAGSAVTNSTCVGANGWGAVSAPPPPPRVGMSRSGARYPGGGAPMTANGIIPAVVLKGIKTKDPLKPGDWICPNASCRFHNFARRVTCVACGTSDKTAGRF
ncbi:hypothetical protein BC830DRAFT_583692 [Chytriomyces sp. MP71]|nr:hypothetical protein BC830DRAFT_583692 [Chytriomyces sp. MP71]